MGSLLFVKKNLVKRVASGVLTLFLALITTSMLLLTLRVAWVLSKEESYPPGSQDMETMAFAIFITVMTGVLAHLTLVTWEKVLKH